MASINHRMEQLYHVMLENRNKVERPISEEQRREFLYAARSQLDKLDFLIQAMVKTSRLETGIITLEKKEAPIADTIVTAINGIGIGLYHAREIITMQGGYIKAASEEGKGAAFTIFLPHR